MCKNGFYGRSVYNNSKNNNDIDNYKASNIIMLIIIKTRGSWWEKLGTNASNVQWFIFIFLLYNSRHTSGFSWPSKIYIQSIIYTDKKVK